MAEETDEMSQREEEVSSESSEDTSSISEEFKIEDQIDEEIRRETEMRLYYYSKAGQDEIDDRLRELDEEWDIERAFEANAAGCALFGLAFGTLFSRKWYLFAALAAGSLLQQSMKGWSPPMSLLRRLGFRTPLEIEAERYALKALRGDFKEMEAGKKGSPDFAKIVEAVEK